MYYDNILRIKNIDCNAHYCNENLKYHFFLAQVKPKEWMLKFELQFQNCPEAVSRFRKWITSVKFWASITFINLKNFTHLRKVWPLAEVPKLEICGSHVFTEERDYKMFKMLSSLPSSAHASTVLDFVWSKKNINICVP